MNLKNKNQAISAVPGPESGQISRSLLGWLNQYASFPAGIRMIDFEYLADDKPCMALSAIQGAYKIAQYITGGYLAQYQFKITYRAQPQDNNDRLKMDEVLNALGAWSSSGKDKPDIGEGLRVKSISCDTQAGYLGRYEGGDEDHQILMTMKYERMI